MPGSSIIREPFQLDYRGPNATTGGKLHAALRDHLSPAEKIVLWALLALAIAFGAIVEKRSAFMHSRHTDLDVYLRGAWTIRTGSADLYTIRDDNAWPYIYPPLFAIAMTPLADPPPGASRAGYLPFACSVALWYVLCLAALAAAVHTLANACEKAWRAPYPRHSRGWWALRIVPLLICLPGIGSDLARGQVNLLILLLLALTLAHAMRHTPRSDLLAGAFLGAAICLKVIPVFLLIYPLARLNWRWLASSLAVMLLGLVVIPLAVVGPTRTVTYYQQFGQFTLGSALISQGDALHSAETTNVADNQSLQAIIQNTLFGHDLRNFVPSDYSLRIRAATLLLGLILITATFLAARRRAAGPDPDPNAPARRTALAFSALILVMLVLSPVCHMAYFALCLPLVMALLATLLETPSLDPLATTHWPKIMLATLALNIIIGILVRLPGFDPLRHIGLAMYSVLALWLLVLWALRREFPSTTPPPYGI